MGIFFKADGGFPGVFVVKDDGDASFGDACLSAFVNEILEILGSNGAHVGDSEDKADGIEDIRFSGPIETLCTRWVSVKKLSVGSVVLTVMALKLGSHLSMIVRTA